MSLGFHGAPRPALVAINAQHEPEAASTFAGVLAIVFWTFTFAFNRVLTESLGPFRTGGYVCLGGGAVALIVAVVRRGGVAWVRRLPRTYLVVCGLVFIVYEFCLYAMISLAADRRQIVQAAILNYTFPMFTTLLSIPLLKYTARRWLPVGIVLAVAGSVGVVASQSELSWADFIADLSGNALPFVLGLACGVLWGLYSVLVRKLAGGTAASGVSFFLLASGAAMLAVSETHSAPARWSPQVVFELTCTILFVTGFAYALWDRGLRRGNLTLLTNLSYLIPVLATIVSALYFQIAIRPLTWAACVLVTIGAWICHRSVRQTVVNTGG